MDFDIAIFVTFAWNIIILVIALIGAKLLQWAIVKIFCSKNRCSTNITRSMINEINQPLGWLLVFLSIYIALPFAQLPQIWIVNLHTLLKPVSVAVLGWFVTGVVQGIGLLLINNHSQKNERDNLIARRFTTQIRIFIRAVTSVITGLTIIGMALVIPALREFGMSLFASAGIAGIAIGIAAKESLSNLIAGIQLALTQQILLGDEVVIQGEFGTVDEITSSYVVVKLWDLRRLIIPLRFFMENSFQNWTYHDSDMIGSIYLYTDYCVDVVQLRVEAERLAKLSPLWDGKVFELLVTNSKENVLELRILISAINSGNAWKLRCHLREQLITHLQQTQPHAMPKTRIHIDNQVDNQMGDQVGKQAVANNATVNY